MGWIPDNVINAMRGSHQLGIFLRIDTTPGLHIWFGVNDIPIGFDSIDPDGTVYLGGGRLIGVPTLEVLVNGTSDSVDFTISGIDAHAGATLLSTIPTVRGAAVQMGITTLDDYFQPMSKVIPIWQGTASHVSETGQTAQGEDSPSLTLSLSVVTGEATRSRPSRTLWSSAQQKAISPTDLFCDATARLSRGVIPVWPNY
ncbi:hypothetical protein [Rhizobium rhizogenes]|uniref:hypothetical protein n=1 Tax=Rhizobium rhizogenes TaxID=359 RepID=UPI0004D36DFE|nr:hypothetical protein [Rhizobium rhizogenes]KEA07476.1 hypothetical protein CN09_11245 [Rhizobium rhizogenes]NTJ22253.1 hypothetical protein [Rhizobium rhizogenes]QUE80971.1 hypothetical protein EML492_03935 [Rhizobium rhizogenes]TQO80924.1 hypothetical protein FFE80_07470 [Rhizobium rhizogenes]TRB51518.1 hypothetical protein EXN69_26355 [Rhizobium rhizogenes]